jgi:hypothetical protein
MICSALLLLLAFRLAEPPDHDRTTRLLDPSAGERERLGQLREHESTVDPPSASNGDQAFCFGPGHGPIGHDLAGARKACCPLDKNAPPVQPRGCMGADKTTLLGPVATVAGLLRKLRAAAAKRNTTLGKVAETVGVTRQYLERVAAKGTMPAQLYIDVCTELGIDPSKHAKITPTTRTLIGKKP